MTQDQIYSRDMAYFTLNKPFGMVGLEAMAAGLPLLVTKHSGLAEFLKANFREDYEWMVVNVGVNEKDRKGDVELWKESIIEVLQNISSKFDRAKALKENLRASKAIKTTHEEFVKLLGRQH